jgi:hypothetical protein
MRHTFSMQKPYETCITKDIRTVTKEKDKDTEKNGNTLDINEQNIGIIKMFENSKEKIPIFVNYDNMIRYHFGIFFYWRRQK